MGQARGTVDKFYDLFGEGKITDATELFDPSCVTMMPSGAPTQVEHEGMGHARCDAQVAPEAHRS